MRYKDARGNSYWVDHGIGGPTSSWMTLTCRTGATSGGHRVKSPRLPLRHTREDAQADLDAYAQWKGLDPE